MMKLLIHLRGFFSKHKDEPTANYIRAELGIKARNIDVYKQALTHRSVSGGSNERLEYLGDALLGIVVADALYHMFENAGEGFLTRVRSRAVCRENLNKVAHQIGLDEHLHTAGRLKNNSENVFGNAFEALVGAIYLDAGFDEAAAFVGRTVIGKNGRNLRLLSEKEVDFKSRLLEYAQSQHLSVQFNLRDERYQLEDDRHIFLYEVVVDDKIIAQSAGYSKREAQQTAARKALKQLKRH